LTFSLPEDEGKHIGLPHPSVAPSASDGIFEHDQFYWDSYFVILALLDMDRIQLAKGIVDNFAYLCDKYGIIPSRNRFYNLGISQPPFLTSMALAVFEETENKDWLRKMAKTAEKELNYWVDGKGVHKVHKGLSRYCDHWHTHMTAEHESGWDLTSRFDDRCLDFLPVDLNSLLYKYEVDLSTIYQLLEDSTRSETYAHKAKDRKETMNELMWDEEQGFFFDYDYQQERRSNFYSLAGFYPLWSEIASDQQAVRTKDNLSVFECDGGLANTQKQGL